MYLQVSHLRKSAPAECLKEKSTEETGKTDAALRDVDGDAKLAFIGLLE